MRETPQVFQIEPAALCDFAHARVSFLARTREFHHLQWLGDDVTDGHARTQRGIRILEYQLRTLTIGFEVRLRDLSEVITDLIVAVVHVT